MKYRNFFPSSSVYKSGVGIKNINHLFINSNKRLLKPKSLKNSDLLQNKSVGEYSAHGTILGEGLDFNNAIQLFCKSKETEIKYLLFKDYYIYINKRETELKLK